MPPITLLYDSLVRRRSLLTVILSTVVSLTAPVTNRSVAEPITKPSTSEYANLPVSNTELRANIRHASLIVRARIVAYKPPTFTGHVATMEETTVVVETTYTGTIKPGETLAYECVCHQVEQPSSPADRIGHQVLLFLAYDKQSNTWSPATHQPELYFSPELEGRVKKLLTRKS